MLIFHQGCDGVFNFSVRSKKHRISLSERGRLPSRQRNAVSGIGFLSFKKIPTNPNVGANRPCWHAQRENVKACFADRSWPISAVALSIACRQGGKIADCDDLQESTPSGHWLLRTRMCCSTCKHEVFAKPPKHRQACSFQASSAHPYCSKNSPNISDHSSSPSRGASTSSRSRMIRATFGLLLGRRAA